MLCHWGYLKMVRSNRISIAMATYNGAQFLPEQLESFLSQSRLPDELVVCDDGSSDNTMNILHEFSASVPFEVRIEQNVENLGYVRNFEKALSLSTGDLVFLSDQDDVWLPQKLRRVEAEFLANPAVLEISNDMIITDAELKHSNATQLGNVRASGLGDRRYAFGCCMALRREFLSILFPFPADVFSHDGWIADVTESLSIRKIIEEPLQLYRRHGNNGSNSFLSDPNKVTALAMVSHLDLASPLSGWDIHYQMIKAKREWIDFRKNDMAALGLERKIAPFIQELDDEERDIRDRVALSGTTRLRRIPRVLSFWMSGRYRRFSGWKSAVKDALRP